jgi:MFS family permease
MRGVVARKGFRALLVGQGVSALGDWMGTVAFMALVLAVTGKSLAVGGILVLRLAPAAVAGPFATRIVVRFDRRRTMMSMDAARAVMVAVVPLVQALWWVYLWAFLIEAAGLVFLPARDSSIPDLVDEADLPLANGLVLASSYGTIPLGAGAFALVASLVGGHGLSSTRGVAPAFFADAGTYVVSMLMVARITELARAARPRRADRPVRVRFRDAFRIPLVRGVALPAFAVTLGLGALFSVGIAFVRDVLGATDTQFGVLIALFGLGAAVGLGVLRLSRARGPRPVRVCIAGQGLVVVAMSFAPTLALTDLGAAGFGACTAAGLAAAMSLLQESLADDERVMAFAAFHVVLRAGLSVAALGAGVADDALSALRWPVVGYLAPARVVLFGAGVVVVAATAATRRVAALSGAVGGTSPGGLRRARGVVAGLGVPASRPGDLAAGGAPGAGPGEGYPSPSGTSLAPEEGPAPA